VDRDPMRALEERVLLLERTVRHLSDQLELLQLTASYAPGVDSVSAERTAELWVEDGIYDTDAGKFFGRKQIIEMVNGTLHRSVLAKGAAHVVSMPRITVTGDTAVGVCHSRLYVRDGDGFRQWRVAANRWEFVRTPEGWRIQRRINRLLDGSEEARALLATGFQEPV
jgi:SnoaL-like domain